MESQTSQRTNAPVALGGIGAIVLIVSPFLKWITAQMDLRQILGSFGIPEGTEIPGFEGTISIVSGNGFEDQIYGWVSLAGGVVALVGVVLVLTRSVPRSTAGYLALAGGLVGGVWALYDGLVRFDSLLEDELAQASGAELGGLPAGITADQVRGALSVSPQIGVWVAALGGALVVIAALMILMSRDPAEDGIAATGASFGETGLGARPAGPSQPPPSASTGTLPATSAPMPPEPPDDPPASAR